VSGNAHRSFSFPDMGTYQVANGHTPVKPDRIDRLHHLIDEVPGSKSGSSNQWFYVPEAFLDDWKTKQTPEYFLLEGKSNI